MEATSLLFLLEVGRWAMTELHERWTLRRKERELELATLTEPQLEADQPEIVADLAADKGKEYVDRTLERIHRKRDLLEGWLDAKVADQKQHSLGDMSLAVLQAKERDYNTKIKNMLREIEADLQALGFTVDKSS